MQTALSLLYPPQCVSCGALVETDFGLCGTCWRDTSFIDGEVCDTCGAPLPGEGDGHAAKCDDCLSADHPWGRGRAALLYEKNARRMVLALKHGDRMDLARPASGWMERVIKPILPGDALVVPIPAHWTRLFRRRYNQAAELGKAMAGRMGLDYAPDVLIRPRRTKTHDGMTPAERFANMNGAIRPHPKRQSGLVGRHVLLVDDVMTSGATFAAATHACQKAGAASVIVLSLARVAKNP